MRVTLTTKEEVDEYKGTLEDSHIIKEQTDFLNYNTVQCHLCRNTTIHLKQVQQSQWNKKSRIFGPRPYVDFKLGKGFMVHLETEMMNTFVPATVRYATTDQEQREWVYDRYEEGI